MTEVIVYIGEFDLRNQNVQAHFVKNNGKIFNKLGYEVFYIGMNRECKDLDEIRKLPPVENFENRYFELPNTLNTSGVFKSRKICRYIIEYLIFLTKKYEVKYIISYKAPTYAYVLKRVINFSREHQIKYIVNCADLPIFDIEPFIKRIVMKLNWSYMHYINKKYADGIIAVSRYIDNFFKKKDRPSVIIPPLFDEPGFMFFEEYINEVPTFIYAGCPFVILNHGVKTSGMKDRLDKVIDLMLELSNRAIDYKFKIIGITKKDYCTCVPRQEELLSSEEKIIFMGKHTHEFTMNELSKADFSINYRDHNLMTEAGFSTKVVESISLGTPVITNRISDIFDYLEEGKTGFELCGDFQSDINKLIRISAMDSKMKNNCKKQCFQSKLFGIDHFINPMKIFLNVCLEKAGEQEK